MYLANRAKYLLLVTVLGFASICQGIGFGELKLYSFLGEPLYAEIAITGFEGMDPHLMQVALASAKDFLRAGIDRPYFLNSLAFQIITHEQEMYVVVRTNKSVQIPYVEFLVELAWPGGELIKEYTVLLDPPPANLSQETRPKGVGQLAALAAQQSNSNQIQEQMDLQKAASQRAAAEKQLNDVVREGKNKFSDNTFDIDVSKKDSLLPGVVPEIPDQTEEYNKQLQAFEQNQATKVAAQPKSLLQKAIAEIDEFEDTDKNVTVKSILAEEAKNQPPQGAAAPNTKTPAEEPVDFNEVIKPSSKKPVTPGATPATPTAAGTPEAGHVLKAPPIAPTAPPEKSSNHVYLGIILSLLLIAAGVGIAIKRGLLTNILHKTPPAEPDSKPEDTMPQDFDEVPVNDHANDKEIQDAMQQFAAIDEDLEEIELAPVSTPDAEVKPVVSTPPTVMPEAVAIPTNPTVGVADSLNNEDPDLTKFEEEFANINLDELSASVQPKVDDKLTDEAILEQSIIEESVIEESVIEEPPTMESVVEEPTYAPLTAEPAAPPAEITSDIKPEDEIIAPPAMQETTTQEPEVVVPIVEPVIEDTINDMPTTEPAIVQPTISEPDETFVATEEVKAPTFDTDLKLEAEAVEAPTTPPPAEPVHESSIQGPTLIPEPESTLKLSEEGVSLVSESESLDNEPEITMKIELAKQYIETGDIDSAKDILRAVIETANDNQKQEAKVLLTSIE